MTIDVRQLTDDDDPAARRLGELAFGYRDPDPRPTQVEGRWSTWGGFDDAHLVAKVVDLHHEQWWGGRVVPASGIAGVAVEPERRGQGVTRAVSHRRDADGGAVACPGSLGPAAARHGT